MSLAEINAKIEKARQQYEEGNYKILTPEFRKQLFSDLWKLEEHPRTGTGRPDQKKYDLKGSWSRRITDTHRLVYDIDDEKMNVVIISAWTSNTLPAQA